MFEKERVQIDIIDQKIARLLEERMAQVTRIAELKKAATVATLDANREKKVLENVKVAVHDSTYHEYVERVFEHIMSESRAFQQQVIDHEEK